MTLRKGHIVSSLIIVTLFSSSLCNATISVHESDLNITWGGSNWDFGHDIVLDDSGNIYITGNTRSFGMGFYDAFIAKYDSAGNSLLNITWGGSDYDSGDAIALDDSGNIYITGRTLSFTVGNYDAFIAKFDSAGNSLLNITWGGSNNDEGDDIVLDNSGNIYITGETDSFGHNAFIAKYDSAGNSLLNITWGGSDVGGNGNGIVLDESGKIYITGSVSGIGAGDYDAFIAKFDSAGNSLLNITWGGSNLESGNDIVLDNSGNIYIVGHTNSFAVGNYDAFIAKFDSAGNSLFNITWGGSHYDPGSGITLDDSGNIYITGRTYSFGAGGYDAFIAKYDNAGNSLRSFTWGGSDDDGGSSIVLDDSGNIYITGYTKSFGSGDRDAFIAKFLSGDDDTLKISGYNLFFLMSIITIVVFIIRKKLKNP
ncbi:MAG: SBBP repeat-containing protein [Promethearchaeota archaeon]